MLRLAHPALTHEEVFLERYERLLSAASTLTAGDREAARDLVHDAYVQFVLTRPPLEPLERVDGYLFITVRNLHISRARRATRLRHESLGMLDFDFAARGLMTLADAHRLEAVDELQRICAFALERRWLARSASAFLLHYFHEYPPSHVARVLHTTAVSTRKMLWLGRSEVRAALAQATPVRGAAEPRRQAPDVQALRDMLFRAPAGVCPHPTQLGRRYGSGDPVDVKTLAHLVCCRPCLEQVNTLLGLPAIDGSHDGRGPNKPDGHSGGSGGSGRSERVSLASSGRAIRATHEHHPKELRIAVNGLPIGMQRVAGPDNEVVVRLSGHDSTMFVEVFSEQDVRLLLLNAEPLASGAARQTAQVALSDGRHLQAELDLTDLQPTLRVIYRDPSLALDWSGTEESPDLQPDETALSAPVVARAPGRPPSKGGRYECRDTDAMPRARRPVVGLRDAFARCLRALGERRVLQLAAASVLVWLLFFPPAAVAATAHRVYQAVVQVLDDAWQWWNGPPATVPAPLPAVPPAPALPPSPAVVAPTPSVERTKARSVALPAFASTELDAWYRAHLVGLVFDRDVSVSHGGVGHVRMTVRVDSDYRRAALVARLEPWARQPGTTLDVETQPAVPVSDADVASPEWLLQAFQMHYAAHVPVDSVDSVAGASVRAIRSDVQRQRALARALRAFATRWPSSQLDRATPDDVTHWATVIRDHALAIGEVAERLRTVSLHPLMENLATGCAPREPISTIHEVEAALTPLLSAADRLTSHIETDVGSESGVEQKTPAQLAEVLCDVEVAARAFAGPLSFIR